MTDGVLELRWARRKEPHLVAKKKPQLEHTKKRKQQLMHESIVCLQQRWRQHHWLPVPHLALPTQQQQQQQQQQWRTPSLHTRSTTPPFPAISKAITICCSLPTTQRAADPIGSCCTACSPCQTPAPRPSWGWWSTPDPIARSSCTGSLSSRVIPCFQEGAVLAKGVTPFGTGISCCYP